MNRLVFNCGSSSIRAALFGSELEVLYRRSLGRLLGDPDDPSRAWREAALSVLAELEAAELRIDTTAHRFVHGGLRFPGSIRVDRTTRPAVGETVRLAPAHHPNALSVLDAVRDARPEIPHDVVFDSVVFYDLPPRARDLGLPRTICEQQQLRRFGFHGFSHEPAARESVRRLEGDATNTFVITCHLGNGCSAAAWCDGEPEDCTMGYSPLSGMLMGTRSGDLDPNLLLDLVESFEGDTVAVREILHRGSGLQGRCGHSDIRDVIAAADAGKTEASEALDLFIYRIQKQICSLLPACRRPLAALAFTGGIGEHQAMIRARICEVHPRILLDSEANHSHASCISTQESPISAFVIEANEERAIAHSLLENQP